jgi:hypothetical protein
VNELLTYGLMLELLIVAYVQLVIMLTKLKKVLSQEIKYLFLYQVYHSPTERTIPKILDVSLVNLYCIRSKYIYIYRTKVYV